MNNKLDSETFPRKINQILMLLQYISPKDLIKKLVENYDYSPEDAYLYVMAAKVMNKNLSCYE